MNKNEVWPYVKRLLIVGVLSTAIAIGIAELTFRGQLFNVDRGPQTVEIVIPRGTAEKVAAGEAEPTLPQEMVFVLGDVLLVRNEDDVAHELGPLVVPPGTSASLPMDNADNLLVNCSFSPSSYLGLEVKEPTTWETRLTGIWFAAAPTTVIFFVYSLVAYPVKAKMEKQESRSE